MRPWAITGSSGYTLRTNRFTGSLRLKAPNKWEATLTLDGCHTLVDAAFDADCEDEAMSCADVLIDVCINNLVEDLQ